MWRQFACGELANEMFNIFLTKACPTVNGISSFHFLPIEAGGKKELDGEGKELLGKGFWVNN